ncbi:NADH-ubiquinone oxidoreductase-F iron-sulfur binding region domain-containing protein [Pseudaquabacterium pictum]|nr:NADH-ubiquinone oxidoreductase-F iron-sulfur binding region domain-containing protein [Rubrivivax pictus]
MPLPEAPTVAAVSPDALRASLRLRRGQLKGRQPDDAARAQVLALLPGLDSTDAPPRDRLIEHLHVMNDQFGALFQRHLVALAALMRLPMAHVNEVASFYHHFQILPDDQTAPRLTVRVCSGLSCQIAQNSAGGDGLLQRLQGLLGEGVQLLPAPCVGRCEQAPVAVVGQAPVLLADAAAVQAQVQQALADPAAARHPAAPAAAAFDPAAQAPCAITHGETDVAPPWVRLAAYRQAGGYQLAADLATGAVAADAVLAAMTDAGLRGLGGAGFPAGRKWSIVRSQPAPRLLAVNLDEGEPGTFKDRTYLERDPHRFLEGLLVAARVVGIDAVWIYLRDEYHGARAILQQTLAELQADPPCPLPVITLRRGAGAYICGEESAMLESIEGKRGEPRLRPPYIAERGLFDRPTLAHNFETLYWVRDIVQRGPAWFSGFGRHGRRGLRSFSVSGRVRQPGVKLAPAGITLRELVDEFCGGMADGHRLQAYLPGGASGGILPARLADVPLDFDTLQPHGCFIGSAAVVVLSQHDSVRAAAVNTMQFFADESCGQCTPCRVGTAKAAALMAAPRWDHATLDDLAMVMADASICGLGQAAPNAIRCVQQYFPEAV